MAQSVALLVPALVTLGAFVPYLRDVVRGVTKPNMASWTTWTVLTALATAAELAAGELGTALITGAAMVGNASIALLGFRYGPRTYTRFDGSCQLAALLGLVLWQVFDTPLIAVVGSVVLDLIAALPTFRHAWLAPHEETWSTFAVAGGGSVLALVALEEHNWVSVTFPAYIVLTATALTATVLVARRSAHRRPAAFEQECDPVPSPVGSPSIVPAAPPSADQGQRGTAGARPPRPSPCRHWPRSPAGTTSTWHRAGRGRALRRHPGRRRRHPARVTGRRGRGPTGAGPSTDR